MPEQETLERAREDKAEGKAPSTQAGEFIREEMDHIREGKHGARSTKQAIAIGLSKARRAGIRLPAPRRGTGFPGRPQRSSSQNLRNPLAGNHAGIAPGRTWRGVAPVALATCARRGEAPVSRFAFRLGPQGGGHTQT